MEGKILLIWVLVIVFKILAGIWFSLFYDSFVLFLYEILFYIFFKSLDIEGFFWYRFLVLGGVIGYNLYY